MNLAEQLWKIVDRLDRGVSPVLVTGELRQLSHRYAPATATRERCVAHDIDEGGNCRAGCGYNSDTASEAEAMGSAATARERHSAPDRGDVFTCAALLRQHRLDDSGVPNRCICGWTSPTSSHSFHAAEQISGMLR